MRCVCADDDLMKGVGSKNVVFKVVAVSMLATERLDWSVLCNTSHWRIIREDLRRGQLSFERRCDHGL